jgi:Uma2 family endonuclease
MSQLSSWVGGQVFRIIDSFVRERALGWVWHADMGYACFPDSSKKVRFPDVSFVRKERLPDELTSEGYIYVPPDLAVEVVSPNDSAYEVEDKVVEFQRVGVPLVWVIFPESRTAYVHGGDGSVVRLREEDELTDDHVLAGFRCRLGDVFPNKPSAENGKG